MFQQPIDGKRASDVYQGVISVKGIVTVDQHDAVP